ncbi:MAG: hypothetical protein CVT63_02335 [Candidatus Anoxymicrobium japonicum]|uniref:Uncharacterized protein n=1 Tax=Candidatus Anoxymicrobium japonicum TaxID=2013648 RepID=A0A2N3G7H1_9ACTN|nr:MAG: hypothetical protein CVT63_02335 [Candidatus Anoxymicrobium japonicum]
MEKIERLINLTAYLLETRRPLSFDNLKETVYHGFSSGDKSLKRMFERDRDELVDMGIDVETVTGEWGDEVGYTISADKYYMPHIDLAGDERVALTMVSRLFLGSGTPFSVPAQLAMLKMAFQQQQDEQKAPHVHWVETPGDGELLGDILDALVRRKFVTFTYRALDSKTPLRRDVEPYGLFNRSGAWYFTGLCRLRGEIRCFKLERVMSGIQVNTKNPKTPDFEVPDGFDIRKEIDWERPDAREAETRATVIFTSRLAFARDRGGFEIAGEKRLRDGRLEVAYVVADAEEFVEWVLGFGTDAVITSPDALKDIARERLEGVLEGLKAR